MALLRSLSLDEKQCGFSKEEEAEETAAAAAAAGGAPAVDPKRTAAAAAGGGVAEGEERSAGEQEEGAAKGEACQASSTEGENAQEEDPGVYFPDQLGVCLSVWEEEGLPHFVCVRFGLGDARTPP